MEEFQPRRFAQSVSEPDSITSTLADSYEEMNEFSNVSTDSRIVVSTRLEWLGSLDDQQFSQIFRGSPIKRTKWKGLMRNVCIALGNSKPRRGSENYDRVTKMLKRLAMVNEPVIAESAQWAISRIQKEESD